MSDIHDVFKNVDEAKFFSDFLKKYLRDGYASLPKRQMDLLVLQLLLSYKKEWNESPPTDYTIARALGMSPRKARSMLDDIAFRDESKDDQWCRQQLQSDLKNAEKLYDKGRVRVQINDGLVRAYATAEIQNAMGIVDSSFNRAIIELSGEKYAALVLELMEPEEREKLLAEIPDEIKQQHEDEQNPKSPIRLFMDSFMKGAGEEAGKKAVQLGVAAITGGASLAVDIVQDVIQSSNGD